MGPKLDFVREDVPNVLSLTFLSFICLTPLFPSRYPAILHSFFRSSPLLLHSGPPRSSFLLVSSRVSSLYLLSMPRFRFPRRRSTTSRRFSTFRGTMHISPIFMEFLVDFFPVPTLGDSFLLLLYFDYECILFFFFFTRLVLLLFALFALRSVLLLLLGLHLHFSLIIISFLVYV